MRLVEGILREVDHLIIDVVRRRLIDAPRDAARDVLLRITIDEVFPLLLHDLRFLLTHGTAHEVRAPHRVAGEITHDLHHLLLVDDTAIGRLEDRTDLRAVVADRFRVLLSLYVLRDEVHRTRSVECDTGDDILDAFWLQPLHEILHAGRLELEHALTVPARNHLVHLRISIVHVLDA